MNSLIEVVESFWKLIRSLLIRSISNISNLSTFGIMVVRALGIAYVLQNTQTTSHIAVRDLRDLVQYLALDIHVLLITDLFESLYNPFFVYLSEVHHYSL